ncbi:MAG: general secretion pathway protein GspB, partial [Thiohalocapsa sp.]
RRAVLGADVSPSVAVPSTPDPAPPPSESTPVPKDLIADIEAFKRQVSSLPPEADSPPKRPKPTAAPKLESPTTPPVGDVPAVASLALRGRLPPFSMTVHIYDADPALRFVYINGRKLKEREQSKEGIRLERILADGAVLSYAGERFFEPR